MLGSTFVLPYQNTRPISSSSREYGCPGSMHWTNDAGGGGAVSQRPQKESWSPTVRKPPVRLLQRILVDG